VQHRARKQTRGRHRATALHRHRAPRTPIAERGRSAMVTAVLAGVGVASVSAASANASVGDGATVASPAAGLRVGTPVPASMGRSVPLPDVAISSPRPARPATQPAAQAARVAPGIAVPAAAAAVPATPVRSAPSRSFVRARQKARPAPKAVWVNPMPEGQVTSCYGQRWGRLHAGVDLAAPLGTPIKSVGAGQIVHAGERGGYGLSVLVDHGKGYFTHYAHMAEISVAVGATVTAGQELGKEGSTGHSTGPHLHFEVHKGVWKNTVEPTGWLRERGISIPGCASSAPSGK
jgi:Peptidase family M23